MSDCCDLKCEREFSKINDSHFQHLGVIKIAKSSSNLALYFRMRFTILVHCKDTNYKDILYIHRGGVSAGAAGALHPRFFGNSLLETKKMEVLH